MTHSYVFEMRWNLSQYDNDYFRVTQIHRSVYSESQRRRSFAFCQFEANTIHQQEISGTAHCNTEFYNSCRHFRLHGFGFKSEIFAL